MPVPTGLKVEIEFVAGTWTNVTADLDWNQGWQFHVGRTTPFQAPSTSSLTFSLRNPTGKYTPGRQVLTDASTAPYYPNVQPSKRVRVTNSGGVRGIWMITSWVPSMDGGFTGRVTVNAVDLMELLDRVQLDGPLFERITSDGPSHYWPMTENSGAATAQDAIGSADLNLFGVPSAVSFGSGDGTGVGNGTSVTFQPNTTSTGGALGTYALKWPVTGFSIELWINNSTMPSWGTASGVNMFDMVDALWSNEIFLFLTPHGFPQLGMGIASGANFLSTGGTAMLDGIWHQIVVTVTAAGAVKLYQDGTLIFSTTGYVFNLSFTELFIGDDRGGYDDNGTSDTPYVGLMGHLALYPTVLTTQQITDHYSAAFGWLYETVDTRIKRWLTVAGLTSSSWDINTSTVLSTTYPQSGTSVLQASQDMTVSEGGGAVFYVHNGLVVFRNRNYRDAQETPTITMDASLDGVADGIQISFDRDSLINSQTVNRQFVSGTYGTYTATDPVSIAAHGLRAGADINSYAQDNTDRIYMAEAIVATYGEPALRFPQLTVDLLTAANNLYAAVQATEIGCRSRVTSVPPQLSPVSTIDGHVEGWTETANINSYQVVFDLSPADSPAPMFWDDATYGHWGADGQTLSSSMTNSTNTMVVATTAGKPTFTTDPTIYSASLVVQIEAEQIQLTAAPGGSSSPQTWTTVTRGYNGTTPSAHPAGAALILVPTVTWGF